MKRLYNWRSRLHGAVRIWSTQPFRWGEKDCIRFADSCVEAMTGESAMPNVVKTYSDAQGAREALAALGYGSISEALAERFEAVEPILAQEGDLAVVAAAAGDELGEALGIVLGERLAVMAPSGGFGTIPRHKMIKAFRVP